MSIIRGSLLPRAFRFLILNISKHDVLAHVSNSPDIVAWIPKMASPQFLLDDRIFDEELARGDALKTFDVQTPWQSL